MEIENSRNKIEEERFKNFIYTLYEETEEKFRKFLSQNLGQLNHEIIIEKPNIVIYRNGSIFSPLKYDVREKTIYLPIYLMEEDVGRSPNNLVRIKEEFIHHILLELNKELRKEYLLSSGVKKEILEIFFEFLTHSILYFITSRSEKIWLTESYRRIRKNRRNLAKLLSNFIRYSKENPEEMKKFLKTAIDFIFDEKE